MKSTVVFRGRRMLFSEIYDGTGRLTMRMFNFAMAQHKALEEGKMTDLKRREILFQQLSPFGDGFIGKLIAPFISEAIALERISDVLPAGFFVGGRGGQTKTGSNVYSPTDEIGTQMSKSFIHLLKGIEPGAVSTGRKITDAITGDVSRGGVPRDLTDEALALFSGIRIINVDVPQTMQYKISEYNRATRAVTETERMGDCHTRDLKYKGSNKNIRRSITRVGGPWCRHGQSIMVPAWDKSHRDSRQEHAT